MLTWKWSGEVRDEKWHAVSAKNWRSQTTFGNWDVENVNAVVARSTCPSQNVQNTPESEPSTFGSWDVGKVYTFVARSTSPSQNVQNTPGSEHVWKFRCRKSARRCGAKHLGSHTNHWKNTVFRDFMRLCYLSAHLHLLSSDSFFFSSLLWLFPPLLFHLSILSEVWLLKFLWVQIHMRLYIHTPRAMHPKGHRHPLLPKVKAIGAQGLEQEAPAVATDGMDENAGI